MREVPSGRGVCLTDESRTVSAAIHLCRGGLSVGCGVRSASRCCVRINRDCRFQRRARSIMSDDRIISSAIDRRRGEAYCSSGFFRRASARENAISASERRSFGFFRSGGSVERNRP